MQNKAELGNELEQYEKAHKAVIKALENPNLTPEEIDDLKMDAIRWEVEIELLGEGPMEDGGAPFRASSNRKGHFKT